MPRITQDTYRIHEVSISRTDQGRYSHSRANVLDKYPRNTTIIDRLDGPGMGYLDNPMLDLYNEDSLGARGGGLGWYITSTSQGHGQSTRQKPTWYISCPCDVLVMYQPRPPPLAPSDCGLGGLWTELDVVEQKWRTNCLGLAGIVWLSNSVDGDFADMEGNSNQGQRSHTV